MADFTNVGKKAEDKLTDWLDKPEEGFCWDRIKDQMSGLYDSKNICDFTLFRKPNFYYIESKATYEDRFDFSMISDYQFEHMLEKSAVAGVKSYVIVLFATYKRAFILDIRDIDALIKSNTKSINIKKIAKWKIPYIEVKTIPSRKELLDYDFEQAAELF